MQRLHASVFFPTPVLFCVQHKCTYYFMWINFRSNSCWSRLKLRAAFSLWEATNHLALDLIVWFGVCSTRFDSAFIFPPPPFKQRENISPLQISCRIYLVCRTLWFVMTRVEYYANTVWHCKSTTSSLLSLSNVFPSCISAMSPQHWAHWIEK